MISPGSSHGSSPLIKVRIAVAVVALALFAACEFRACLAQSDIFQGLRPDLIDQCCTCLANNGTRHPAATCAIAYITTVDGGPPFIAVDAGSDPDGGPGDFDKVDLTAGTVADDKDGIIEEDEVPCLCSTKLSECKAILAGNGKDGATTFPITGACIEQGGGFLDGAPCRNECDGVITFDPLVP